MHQNLAFKVGVQMLTTPYGLTWQIQPSFQSDSNTITQLCSESRILAHCYTCVGAGFRIQNSNYPFGSAALGMVQEEKNQFNLSQKTIITYFNSSRCIFFFYLFQNQKMEGETHTHMYYWKLNPKPDPCDCQSLYKKKYTCI